MSENPRRQQDSEAIGNHVEGGQPQRKKYFCTKSIGKVALMIEDLQRTIAMPMTCIWYVGTYNS